MKPQSFSLILALILFSSPVIEAQDSLELEGTSITGNKELPMVLYILPWKSAERFEIEAPPIDSIMDQTLVPLDRASFKRTINYHQAIYSRAEPIIPATE